MKKGRKKCKREEKMEERKKIEALDESQSYDFLLNER